MDVGCLCSILEGAHLNPAFSLAMCLLGRLPWAKLPIYCFVQVLSAFCASGATYALYYGNRGNGVWGCPRVGRGALEWFGMRKMGVLGVPLPCRCPTELYRREPDCDRPQGDSLHLCHLPCSLSVPEQWLLGSGRWGRGRPGRDLCPRPLALEPIVQSLGQMGCGVRSVFALHAPPRPPPPPRQLPGLDKVR